MTPQIESLSEIMELIFSNALTPEKGRALHQLLLQNPTARKEYVNQLRIHFLLKEEGAAICSQQRMKQKGRFRNRIVVAAIAILCLTLSITSWKIYSSNILYVDVISKQDVNWMDQMSPIDWRAYHENRKAEEKANIQTQFVKYGPGVISNPGAAIKILAITSKRQEKTHLHPGDCVWRSQLGIEEGQIKIGINEQTKITLHGPSKIEIIHENRIRLHFGTFITQTTSPALQIELPDRGVVSGVAEIGFFAYKGKNETDLLVFNGNAEIFTPNGELEAFLYSSEGVRRVAGEKSFFFQNKNLTADARRFFLSKTKIVVKK